MDRCEMMTQFDSAAVWQRFCDGQHGSKAKLSLFMAVPTIYGWNPLIHLSQHINSLPLAVYS